MSKVDCRIKHLKDKTKFFLIKKVLLEPNMIYYLINFQNKYVMCPIDKTANNTTSICNKYYFQVIPKELGLAAIPSTTYETVNETVTDILHQQNSILKDLFNLKNEEGDYICLSTIYWLPKIHNKPWCKIYTCR